MIYDVSYVIEPNMQVYKNKDIKKPIFKAIATHDEHRVYETNLTLNLHTGTHLDFPLHMIKHGQTSTNFDIKRLIRTVKVLDLSHLEEKVTDQDLMAYDLLENDFLLIKTRNSFETEFNPAFIYFDQTASEYIKTLGCQGVGIDALGIERQQENYPTHHTFFNHDMLIIEGLRLKDVKEGQYLMIALPLSIDNVEALPLRVVLFDTYEDLKSLF